ncbi:uncharacterized protein K444DRAFT_670503 [Hyaloscypha bicolor E]|uniref:Apple domain-containing protein n=1 Tax=Hyaloscypha bicolor E TaxID=1095630 RepID=A0A2J6SGV1_9HELO|nr:uncharacterized protein K444DRAFT_670503 [Hyaloscypha bicolor E]PMD50001.1 hypothetical protein K444DRAFT_670503 [Hyaloscypha bicolor E]
MHFITLTPLLLLSGALTAAVVERNGDHDYNDMDDSFNIFKDSNSRWEGAICKSEITTKQFPTLTTPPNFRGGCVRYFQGIDMTGVVTEVDIFFPTVKTACDCISLCLSAPTTCTNWVFKHTNNPAKDSGRRSCTLYSSPNLPTDVTLGYNLTDSIGFQLLQAMNNPQAGGGAPTTVLDNGNPDPFGVSGFLTQDVNGKLYC